MSFVQKNLQLFNKIKKEMSSRFNLLEDMAPYEEISEAIIKSAQFKGANLWILMTAVFVASIGLNMNSTAVIIGAMLISPLMGPITAIGHSIAVFDFELMKTSFKGLFFAALVALITSTCYFFLTPLDEAQSEILARTSPVIWDVLIATFGGIAGMIGATRKTGGNVIPGVAIATALMPPLCTAGYGLATLQFQYFFGAFYLFLINSVFIGMASMLITVLLKFPKKIYVDLNQQKRIQIIIAIVLFLTMAPSLYISFGLVREGILNSKINRFISHINGAENLILKHNLRKIGEEGYELKLVLLGHPLSQDKILEWQQFLTLYEIERVKLTLDYPNARDNNKDLAEIKSGILEELYKKNEQALADKDQKISFLEKELLNYKAQTFDMDALIQETKILFKELEEFTITTGKSYKLSKKENLLENKILVALKLNPELDKKTQESILDKIQEWLKLKTKSSNILILMTP